VQVAADDKSIVPGWLEQRPHMRPARQAYPYRANPFDPGFYRSRARFPRQIVDEAMVQMLE
jgi:hypothetical protein